MHYSSRTCSGSRKQTSIARTSTTRVEEASPSGNETDGGSLDLLNISTSREDLSRGASRCSCHSGESGNLKTKGEQGHSWTNANLKLEFETNAGSEDELLKEELLRIFDRERFGLESYFKLKTERIIQDYRRKQCEWEDNVRLEKIDYEKTLAQEKIEVQQNYISEMTKLTKQFNQERVELESHYKKQISELTHQFEMRKKDMDETIIKERTELKQRLELEYQSMLNSQRTADQQHCRQQMSELEDEYKNKIILLEHKLKESISESDFTGRKMQADLEARFENERSSVVVEWRKRVELLELELGKEKERANKEERKVCESHSFMRTEVKKKEAEIERLRQNIETLKTDISKKESTAKESDMLQQNIFLRGSEALPGKMREDFEKMMAAYRQELERTMKKDREGLETERERRVVLERETLEKQLKMERERMALEMEKERGEMRRESREKEDTLREELRRELERVKTSLEAENKSLREQVKDKVGKEGVQIGERFVKEKDERDKEIQLNKVLVVQEEEKRKGLERDEYESWVSTQKMRHTKQWVEGQHVVTGDNTGSVEDTRRSERKGSDVLPKDENRSDEDGLVVFSNTQVEKTADKSHRSVHEEKNVTNVTVNVDNDKNSEYGLRAFEEENQGLKAKVIALQENIRLHECYKTEASKEIERLRKTNKEMKIKLEGMRGKMKEYEERFEDYEGRLGNSEEKLKEYESICEDYEKYLQECREQILVIEKDRETSILVRRQNDDGSGPENSQKNGENSKNERRREIMSEERSKSRDEGDEKESEDNYRGRSNTKYKQSRQIKNDSMVDILQVENTKLQRVVQDLEDKVRFLEKKISEISTVAGKVDTKVDAGQKRELKSSLTRVQRQNRDLVNKVKDLQFQLQGMVDKLRKEKKKVTFLHREYHSFKSTRQSEIKELQTKLECSGKVIERLQSASVETNAVDRLQDEISAISKLMMEERLNEQRMSRARSVEELNKSQEMDREKSELEKKLQEAKVALDGYSERLRHKVSHTEITSSQLSLNGQNDSFLRDVRLSKTIEALGDSQRRSLRQNERLIHEKKELQSLVGRLCKSQEDLRDFGGSKLSLSSRSSSVSSLSSSSSVSSTSRLHSMFSSTFSFLD